jgi:hypothetical protein
MLVLVISYQETLPVVLTDGGGTYSGFTAYVVNGAITSINAGTSSGYTTAPTVSIHVDGGSGINITFIFLCNHWTFRGGNSSGFSKFTTPVISITTALLELILMLLLF